MQGTYNLVKEELEKNPETRNSDDLLYLNIITRLKGDSKLSISCFFKNRNKLNLPPYETVSRCRRRLQRQYPHLQATEEVEVLRSIKEEEFRRWSHE